MSNLLFFRVGLFLFLFLKGAIYVSAQRAHVQVFNENQGMHSRLVYAGVQDSYGYIWLASHKGLQRFDGHQFILFESPLVQNGRVKTIQVVKQGDWLFLLYGEEGVKTKSIYQVDVFNVVNHQYFTFDFYFKHPLITESRIEWIAPDPEGNIFFLLSNGEVWFLNHEGAFTYWARVPAEYRHLVVSHLGHVFTVPVSAFFLPEYNKYLFIKPKEDISKGIDSRIWDGVPVYDNGKLAILYTNHASLNTYNLENPFDSHDIKIIKVDPAIYLRNLYQREDPYTASNIFIYNDLGSSIIKDNEFKLIDGTGIVQIHEDHINGYMKDSQGKLWLFSSDGLLLIDIKDDYFQTFLSVLPESKIRLEDQTRGMAQFQDSFLFVGYWRDLAKINLHTHAVQLIPNPEKEIIYAVNNHFGEIYFGTRSVYQLDRQGEIVNKASLTGTQVWSMYSLDSNILLVGLYKGLGILNLETNELLKFDFELEGLPIPTFIYKFIKDSKGQLWAAGDGGLYRIGNDGIPIEHLGFSFFPTDRFHDLHIDADGVFWLASADQGLIKWNPQNDQIEVLQMENGLTSNTLYSIEEDGQGRLWIGSINGLHCIHKEILQVLRIFNMNDGLPFSEFNRIASYKDHSGNIYFGGLNGVVYFNPELIQLSFLTLPTTISISRIRKFFIKENIWKDEFVSPHNDNIIITLNSRDGPLNVELTMLDYLDGDYKYYFKIDEGGEWILVDHNIIRFNRLSFGKHDIFVKGTNPAGLQSIPERLFTIHVLPPFYLRWWFIFSVILVISGLTTLFNLFRLRMARRENQKLEHLVENKTHDLKQALAMKDMLLRELDHRVKNYLYIIDSLLELQKEEINDPKVGKIWEESQKRIKSIYLMHQNLAFTEGSDHVNLKQFLLDLIQQFDDFISLKEVHIQKEISLKNKLYNSNVAMPLGLIINEWLTNSFKHAFNRKDPLTILLRIHDEDEFLEILYEDSGTTLKTEKFYQGSKVFGIGMIDSLVKQMDGELQMENTNGIKFSLRVPYGYSLIKVKNDYF